MPSTCPLYRIILHIDFNCFYVSAASLYNPSLRNVPAAVTGDMAERCGVLLAKNYQAKAFGVRTGETISEARAKCPHLTTVEVDFPLYYIFADGLLDLCLSYSDRVKSGGDDEAYVELTGSVASFDEAVAIADEIRRRSKEEFGIPCSVGVSFTCTLAKAGSDLRKPDATSLISPDNFKDVIWPLPADTILGVGSKVAARFRRDGILTVGDIAKSSRIELGAMLGKIGDALWLTANGLDRDPVPYIWEVDPAKSVGNSKTLPRDIHTRVEVKAAYFTLAENVASRMRDTGVAARTVHASIRSSKLQWTSRQMTLQVPTQRSDDLVCAAMALYDQAGPLGWDIRSLGLSCTNLVDLRHNVQQTLLPPDQYAEKAMAMERAKDEIWRRFGRRSLTRATEMVHRDITALTFKEDRRIGSRSLSVNEEEDSLQDINFVDVIAWFPSDGSLPLPKSVYLEDEWRDVGVCDIVPAFSLKLTSPGNKYVCIIDGSKVTLYYNERHLRWGITTCLTGEGPVPTASIKPPIAWHVDDHDGKTYVAVDALCHADDRPPTPRIIWWADGRSYLIGSVSSPSWAASERAGGVGYRYNCSINGHVKLVYYEPTSRRWFVEMPMAVYADGLDDAGAPVKAGFTAPSLAMIEALLASNPLM